MGERAETNLFLFSHLLFLIPFNTLKCNTLLSGASVVENSDEIPRMDARFAESVVRKWQSIKSLALGPDHCLGKLTEVRVYFLIWFTCYYAPPTTLLIPFSSSPLVYCMLAHYPLTKHYSWFILSKDKFYASRYWMVKC